MRTPVSDKHPLLPLWLITACGIPLISCCQLLSWILMSSTETKLRPAFCFHRRKLQREPRSLPSPLYLKFRPVRPSSSSTRSLPRFPCFSVSQQSFPSVGYHGLESRVFTLCPHAHTSRRGARSQTQLTWAELGSVIQLHLLKRWIFKTG